jgi:hypothetical protein
MNRIWRGVAAIMLAIGGSGVGAAQADVVDVECSRLEKISIDRAAGYDETICMAGQFGGLASGESRRPVGVDMEVIIAFNRATFALVRFVEANSRSFMELPSLREYGEDTLAGFAPRNWGEERRKGRFVLADPEARMSDDSPYLPCVGFLVRMRPIGGGAGYRESLSGLYCAVDMLTPTPDEVTSFLEGLEF